MGLGNLKPVGVQLSRDFVYLKKYPPNHPSKLVNSTTTAGKLGRDYYERLRRSGGGGGGGDENKRGSEETPSKLTRKGLMRSATSLACMVGGGRRRGGGDSSRSGGGVGVSVSLSDKVYHCPGASFLGNAHANVNNGWNNLQTPVAHCWSEPSHFKRKYCHVCRKRLDDHVALKCESK